MKTFLITIPVILMVGIVSFFIGRSSTTEDSQIFQLIPTPTPTPLAKYTVDAMKSASIRPAEFSRIEVLKETDDFISYSFSMSFDPTLTNEPNKKTTGVLNIPKREGQHPLVVMIRGFVDQKVYAPGVGTKNGAEYFAKQGYITIAPDFLGYAGSDTESGNIFESRFQTYTTVLSLLNSIATPSFGSLVNSGWDGKNIFIWAHSNGGQIALTTLAVTGLDYPTVLWAPVTKPFPYSVLYYTDESVDGGKFIRKELAKFENLYDVNQYSFTNYLSNIKAPLQFSQGTADDAVPYSWTRAIVTLFKKAGVDTSYNEYPGSDHNLRPAWDTVIEKNLEFFQKWMK